ncbi:MAG: LacI family DNA-binding transcriptional regulator [Firmicutes bacterium]|nr:LacI family DNA-binding transcriptional regulator [Bacillota bacterium]
MKERSEAPTIRDVAHRAGVSPATVSSVLRGSKRVSDITRRKVEEAIRQLGYRPNAVARSLRTHESRAIGLVVPDITNPFYADIAQGVTLEARDNGYTVVLVTADEAYESVMEAARTLVDRQVDGMVFTNIGWDYPMPDRAIEGVPYVMVNRHGNPVRADYVGVDNYAGALDAMQHLVDLGHRCIAFIGGMENSSASQRRLEGYLAAVRQWQLAADPDLVQFGHLRYDKALSLATQLPDKHRHLTAIFAADDMMAMGVLDGLDEIGLRVPEDISVVGFDGIWPGALSRVQLTTVAQPREEIGREAMRLIRQRIHGFDGEPQVIQLPYRLAIRKSTARARRRARRKSVTV